MPNVPSTSSHAWVRRLFSSARSACRPSTGSLASLLTAVAVSWLCSLPGLAQESSQSPQLAEPKPNFVVLFADDLGYADLHCFGGAEMLTPNLDAMARQGMRLTSFYASQPVCSASRCSLLTGCYNVRLGIHGALGPGSSVCLNPAEETIAEVLKPAGYATAIYGKWHLGDRGIGLPTQHGFDEYHGLPYSNDMWPSHPTAKHFPPLPLYDNAHIINPDVTADDQQQLTRGATERAVDFIERHHSQPFFLYVPYSMPHVPLFTSDEFSGATGRGLFADVIAEIDWSVGEILKALNEQRLTQNTLVLFTSDNGPWLSYGTHAGSAAPFREGKGTTFEGGVREPTIAYWPGRIPAGAVCDAITSTIDVLPTLARLAGAELPQKKIDGADIWPLLAGRPGAESPHEAFYYYYGNNELQAIRSGPWKLHFPHSYRSLAGATPRDDGQPVAYQQLKCGLELYNLDEDIGETRDVAAQHPRVVERLQRLADDMRGELGDSLTGVQGRENRPPGRVN